MLIEELSANFGLCLSTSIDMSQFIFPDYHVLTLRKVLRLLTKREENKAKAVVNEWVCRKGSLGPWVVIGIDLRWRSLKSRPWETQICTIKVGKPEECRGIFSYNRKVRKFAQNQNNHYHAEKLLSGNKNQRVLNKIRFYLVLLVLYDHWFIKR